MFKGEKGEREGVRACRRGVEEQETNESRVLTSPFPMALLATRPPSWPGSAAGVSIPRSSTSQRISDAEAVEVRVARSAEESKRRRWKCKRRRWHWPTKDSKTFGAAAVAGLAAAAARREATCSGPAAATLGRWNDVRMVGKKTRARQQRYKIRKEKKKKNSLSSQKTFSFRAFLSFSLLPEPLLAARWAEKNRKRKKKNNEEPSPAAVLGLPSRNPLAPAHLRASSSDVLVQQRGERRGAAAHKPEEADGSVLSARVAAGFPRHAPGDDHDGHDQRVLGLWQRDLFVVRRPALPHVERERGEFALFVCFAWLKGGVLREKFKLGGGGS